jgi:membrane fusion protein, heavy metal efflux system
MPASPERFIVVASAAVVIAAALLLSPWNPAPGATGPGASSPAAKPVPAPQPTAATIELSAAQLQAVRIAAAQMRPFPVEVTAVGSISFDEDPAIVQAESTLIAAASTLEVTTRELSRVRGLGEGNGIAQKELEQAASSQETAEAALEAARDAVRALGKSDTEIDRMIGARRIEGAPAGPHTRKWALANVAESDSVSVHRGQAVSLTVLAYPDRSFHGEVSRVYSAVDPTTHRVAVRARITDPASELRAGMLADVAIRVREPVQSPAVPANAAVREADGTTSVWVTSDRRHFSQRAVRTGQRSDGWVQILDGLRAGELVVTDGAVFLSNMLQAPPGD